MVYVAGVKKTDLSAAENQNENSFQLSGVNYIGPAGTAIALNIGTKNEVSSSSAISKNAGQVAALLADQNVGKDSVISTNMQFIATYANILKTDVTALLNNSADRQSTLQSLLDDLDYNASQAQNQIASLQNDQANVQATLNASDANLTQIKNRLSNAYAKFDADGTKSAFDDYVTESGNNAYNRAYLVLVGKFIAAYQSLNAYEQKLYNTLNANQQALIKNVTVVLPKSGNDLLGPLNLLQSE